MDKLKQILGELKKRPWLLAVVGAVVVLGLIAGARKKTETAAVEEVPLSTGGGGTGGGATASDINSALSGVVQSLNSRLDEQDAALTEANNRITEGASAYNSVVSKLNEVTNSFNSYATNTNAVIAETNKSLTSFKENAAAPVSKEDPLKSLQIAATNQIKNLQTQYADVKTKAMSDGKLDAAEKAALNKLHTEADTIGYAAGLQSTKTTTDGSGRKLVQ